MVSALGIAIMVLGRHLIFGSLHHEGNTIAAMALRISYHQMEVTKTQPFWGAPHHEDHSILGSTFALPMLWKLPYLGTWTLRESC